MEKKTTIVCAFCGEESEKAEREIKRQLKKGRTKFYCSLSCSKKEAGHAHLADWVHSEENKTHIQKLAGNVRDEYTDAGLREHLRRAQRRNGNDGRRNHHCNLDLEHLKEVWDRQDGKCVYTNVKLEPPTQAKKSNKRYNYMASLDRIDSSLGYVKGNVQFISVTCNFLKTTLDDNHVQEFFMIIRG